jgi:magnesium chelatase accessory protein
MSRGLDWSLDRRDWPNHRASRFVTVGAMRWHVQQAGEGPVLLLVHGTGSSTHTWRDFLPDLARDYTVVAPDLPGHGFTAPAGPGGYTIPGMCASLQGLLHALRLEPAYAIGHSAGAAILCHMALTQALGPRRIVSLNGAFLPFAGAASSLFSPVAKLLAGSATLSRLIAWRARDVASVERIIAGTGSRLDARGLDLYSRLVGDPRHVAAAFAMMGNWDLQSFERELGGLTTPLTLLVGERDLAVPPSQGRFVQGRVAHADLRLLPGLGHLAHEEAPGIVLPIVRAALRS